MNIHLFVDSFFATLRELRNACSISAPVRKKRNVAAERALSHGVPASDTLEVCQLVSWSAGQLIVMVRPRVQNSRSAESSSRVCSRVAL